jgi:AcrR family transcriptional regulator
MDISPRNRRHDLTKQKILDTARQILLTEGVQAISMRTLADRVDYSPAALYKYFANKEEIIAALRQEAWEMMAAHPSEISPGMTLPEIFVQSGRGYIDFATKYPEYYMLIMSTAEGGPNSLEEFKQTPNFVGLLQFVESVVAAGEFQLPPGYTPMHLALLSWFTVHGISLLKLTVMNKCPDEFEAASVEVLNMVKEVFTRK